MACPICIASFVSVNLPAIAAIATGVAAVAHAANQIHHQDENHTVQITTLEKKETEETNLENT